MTNDYLLREWTDDLTTPLASDESELYPQEEGTPSVTDEYRRKATECVFILRTLQRQSAQLAESDDQLLPISANVFRDSHTFLLKILERLPAPEIDWESETGFVVLSWSLGREVGLLSTAIRGDYHVIYSAVFFREQFFEGTPLLDASVDIICSVFESASLPSNG